MSAGNGLSRAGEELYLLFESFGDWDVLKEFLSDFVCSFLLGVFVKKRHFWPKEKSKCYCFLRCFCYPKAPSTF